MLKKAVKYVHANIIFKIFNLFLLMYNMGKEENKKKDAKEPFYGSRAAPEKPGFTKGKLRPTDE